MENMNHNKTDDYFWLFFKIVIFKYSLFLNKIVTNVYKYKYINYTIVISRSYRNSIFFHFLIHYLFFIFFRIMNNFMSNCEYYIKFSNTKKKLKF